MKIINHITSILGTTMNYINQSNEDKRKEEDWIKDEIIQKELAIDRKKRPFKIPYIDEDWILGHTCKPENIEKTIQLVLYLAPFV